jgi:aminopeptidase-like protein
VDDQTPKTAGDEMLRLVQRLYPICRSITGDGVRETLRILGESLPLEVREVPTGTPVFDWTVPDEWNIRDAWIATTAGRRVVDFRESNLHVVSYSEPIRGRFRLEDLRSRLHVLEAQPDWIPYRTSYYTRSWGFCLSGRAYEAFQEPEYDVCIDSSLGPGALTYGELVLPGEVEDEYLISAHVCHPSLANDNLSGIAVSLFLARELGRRKTHFSYRFLYAPGTIGSLTWLSQNRERLDRVRGGMTLVCLGDARPLTYKKSVAGDSVLDRAAGHVLEHWTEPGHIVGYHPFGYDERQFNSPGFRIPFGSLMRGRHGEFPEYHTSADNLAFVSAERLQGSLDACLAILSVLDQDRAYRSLAPHGEPQLGRRGIYRAMGGVADPGAITTAMLWLLALSDGTRSILDIAERAGLRADSLSDAAEVLEQHELLERCPKSSDRPTR